MQQFNYSREVVTTMLQMQRRLAGSYGVHIKLDDEEALIKLLGQAQLLSDKLLKNMAKNLSMQLSGNTGEVHPRVKQAASNGLQSVPVNKPASRTIIYRGQVIEKPVEEQAEEERVHAPVMRVYRGAIISK